MSTVGTVGDAQGATVDGGSKVAPCGEGDGVSTGGNDDAAGREEGGGSEGVPDGEGVDEGDGDGDGAVVSGAVVSGAGVGAPRLHFKQSKLLKGHVPSRWYP